jgi:hypothetical protein
MIIVEKEIKLDTNEEIITEREATSEELAQWQAHQAAQAERETVEATKAAEKAAATAKLAALGLTEDDLKALGLGNN